ncbi:MAG: DegV family protein [Chloroflexota bacterium]|nr:DegV family protein [Chloroflexota bacterium]MED5255246.1 DegV family protein [Chloroflexota bacterium]MQF83224.1 DegV family protein [SAR202 cluster bacterium]|tara:strand:+ start:252 stop:1088 length:837 start_codon:yes stop_codon:yes gene_type:complete
MSKIALVTDSTCDLPESVVKDKNITVIPLNVHFGEETFLDGIDLQSNEFFEKLSTSEIHPQTSQPSVGRFVETYNDLLKKHDSILSLHISSKLSATYNSALQAQKEIGNENIKVIDSMNGTLGLGAIVHHIADLNQKGESFENLVKEAEKIIPNAIFMGLVPTLEYLAKGGRIGKARAFMGSLLKIKPILSAVDGEIQSVGKARTLIKGMDFIVDEMKNRKISKLFIVHANHEERANLLKEKTKDLIDPKDVIIAEFGPVVGTHLGPGAFGVGFISSE